MNPRYDGSLLNLKLKSRYLKGNFKVINIGSLCNLTFSSTNISSNTKILKSLVEGNNLFCQEFVHALNPILISNTEVFKRKDSFGLTTMVQFLIKYVSSFSQCENNNQLNILNLSANSAGFSNICNLKAIKNKDFKDSTGVYFINESLSTSNIRKLLNLKLLNIFQDFTHNSRILITQNNHLNTKLIMSFKKCFNLNNHLHLPNTVLFEASGTYINTEGVINKTPKIVTPTGQTKSDWQIIRKIFSYSKKMLFMTHFSNNNKISFNTNSIFHFRNYIGFHYYAISDLNILAFKLLKKFTTCDTVLPKFKTKKKKLYSSQLRFWLNDFYIEGKNSNSNYSSTMVQCSKLSRLINTNFKF